MGGTNFWGRRREEDCFLLPSFDDRILEVVAVFGTVQMAASRIINLQHHRIAQCQTVKITILGQSDSPPQRHTQIGDRHPTTASQTGRLAGRCKCHHCDVIGSCRCGTFRDVIVRTGKWCAPLNLDDHSTGRQPADVPDWGLLRLLFVGSTGESPP